ncbi:hypothetical protein OH77DRAFT_1480592, partial [Trametes cingulata]
MVRAAEKYGVRCVAPNPTPALRNALPIWYHRGMNDGRSTANTAASKCLRERHQVTTTAQCARVAARLAEGQRGHAERPNCGCYDCDRDRRVFCCENPHRCATAARKLISRLTAKWHPERRGNNDGLTLTQSRLAENEVARVDNERITFDPSLAQGLPLAAVFRIFVAKGDEHERVALRRPRGFQVEEEAVEVY